MGVDPVIIEILLPVKKKSVTGHPHHMPDFDYNVLLMQSQRKKTVI
jgi:hypothetical protein